MRNIEHWFREDSVGRGLFSQESAYLDTTIARLVSSDSVVLSLGPLDILKHIKISIDGSVYCSDSLPSDIVCDYTCLPVADNSIDTLICYHAFEFCKHKALLTRELARVLRPNGSVLIYAFNPHQLWLRNPKWQGWPVVSKKDCWSVGQISQELVRHSLQVIEGKFMFYTPLFISYFNLQQIDFLEKAGDRWWPNLSTVYALIAKKERLKPLLKPLEQNVIDTLGLVPLAKLYYK